MIIMEKCQLDSTSAWEEANSSYRHSSRLAKFPFLIELPAGKGHWRDGSQFAEIDAISIKNLVTKVVAPSKPQHEKGRQNR